MVTLVVWCMTFALQTGEGSCQGGGHPPPECKSVVNTLGSVKKPIVLLPVCWRQGLVQ